MSWKPLRGNDPKSLQQNMVLALLASKANKPEGQTLIHCRYYATRRYVNGGWVNIFPTTYLVNAQTSSRIALVHALDVPVAPARHYFTQAGQCIRFTLLFPRIPRNWKQFDLVEEGGSGCFRVSTITRNDSGVYYVDLK